LKEKKEGFGLAKLGEGVDMERRFFRVGVREK